MRRRIWPRRAQPTSKLGQTFLRSSHLRSRMPSRSNDEFPRALLDHMTDLSAAYAAHACAASGSSDRCAMRAAPRIHSARPPHICTCCLRLGFKCTHVSNNPHNIESRASYGQTHDPRTRQGHHASQKCARKRAATSAASTNEQRFCENNSAIVVFWWRSRTLCVCLTSVPYGGWRGATWTRWARQPTCARYGERDTRRAS